MRNARLGDREWFGFHVMALGIGAWNLFAIDFARGPEEWWFWMPVAAWSAVLWLHAVWVFGVRRSRVAPVGALRRSGAGR